MSFISVHLFFLDKNALDLNISMQKGPLKIWISHTFVLDIFTWVLGRGWRENRNEIDEIGSNDDVNIFQLCTVKEFRVVFCNPLGQISGVQRVCVCVWRNRNSIFCHRSFECRLRHEFAWFLNIFKGISIVNCICNFWKRAFGVNLFTPC